MNEQPVVFVQGPPSSARLRQRLASPTDDFFILPVPPDDAVGGGRIDLRVGRLFLSAERSSAASIDANDFQSGASLFREVWIATDGSFVMQPRQFVLASTFEYIAMPLDLMGLIQSRSTYGRMGLIAATASFVGPGYKGCPTLELVNAGEVPVRLHPYDPICQLVVLPAAEDSVPPSRYHMATRPDFARKALGTDLLAT